MQGKVLFGDKTGQKLVKERDGTRGYDSTLTISGLASRIGRPRARVGRSRTILNTIGTITFARLSDNFLNLAFWTMAIVFGVEAKLTKLFTRKTVSYVRRIIIYPKFSTSRTFGPSAG